MKLKRITSVFLALVMLLSVCSVTAFADGVNYKEEESFIGSNKLRLAGKLDLFGLDLQVDPSYNATLTVYKGHEGYSSEEEAGIRIAVNNMEHIGSVDKWIDVGNVGIDAILERLEGTQVDPNAVTYDWIYSLLKGTLFYNLNGQTIAFKYGEKTSNFALERTIANDDYTTLTITADDVDFGEDWEALMNDGAIAVTYDENADENIGATLKEGSYVRLGNQRRTLTSDVALNALDSTGEIDLANITSVLMGDIETTETLAANDGKAVFDLKTGTAITVGKTTATLGSDIRITVEGLNITDNFIDKLVKVTEGQSDVQLNDYTDLLAVIPNGGTVAITAEVNPEAEVDPEPEPEPEVDTTSEAFLIHGDEVTAYEKATAAVTAAVDGDTIQLNPNYAETGVINTTLSISKSVTLDLNGATLTKEGVVIGATGNGKTLTVINSSDNPAEIICTKNSTSTSYGALRCATANATLEFGGADSVGEIIVTAASSNALCTNNATATINVYGGTFTGAILQPTNKGTIAISGGTFDHDPSTYVAEGYEAVNNGDSTWTVETTKVAQIGNVKYTTFEEAVEAAQAGDTITMIDDEALASTVTITKNLMLDFAGHTLTAARQALVVNGNYNLTVDDSVGNGGITVSASSNYQGCIQALGGGTLTIDGGTFTASRSGSNSGWVYNIYVKEGSSLVMNGGEIVVPSTSTVDYNYGIYVEGTGNVTMTGGRITMNASGGNYGIKAGGSGAVVMSGGYIDGTSYFRYSGFRMFYPQGISLTGSGTVAVSGGYISAPDGRAIDNEGKESRVEITGGCFTLDAYWPDSIKTGYERINNPDSETNATYPKAVVPKAVATIGTARYTTLEAAVEAAQAGDTVTILKNITYTDWVYLTDALKNKAITITGGKTLTSTGNNFGFYFGDHDANTSPATDTLDLEDLTFVKNGGNYTMLFDSITGTLTNVAITGTGNSVFGAANGAQVILENCTIENFGYNKGTTATWRDAALSAQGIGEGPSVLTVKSGTYTSEHGYAVYIFSSGGIVNIEGGTFAGRLCSHIDRGTYHNDYNRSIINISGGTFTNVSFEILGNAEYAQIVITGGTFDHDPAAYVAPGYEAVEVTPGTWQVGEVKATAIAPTETEVGYDATYSATKQVVDGDNVLKQEEATITVNVKAVTENTAASDTAIEKISEAGVQAILDEVVAKAEENTAVVSVEIKVVRDTPVVENNTITYEVHPEATAYVNDVAITTVKIANEDLAENATFTITLPVPDALMAGNTTGKVKVTHRSSLDDEIANYEVQGEAGNYYVTFTVTHFSEFEIAVPDPLPSIASKDFECNATLSLEDEVIINLYVENLKDGNHNVEANPGRYKVVYTFNGVTKTEKLTSATSNHFVAARCAAAQLTDTLHIALYYDGELLIEGDYSASTYCHNKINGDNPEGLKTLCASLLNYGGAAQNFFEYHTENMAGLTGAELAYGSDYEIPESYNLALNAAGVSEVIENYDLSASLSLEANTQINVYFRPYAATDYKVLVNGAEVEYTKGDFGNGYDLIHVAIPGIASKHLGNGYEITIQNLTDTAEYTFTYSPMNWAYRTYNNNGSTYAARDLCKALYNYFLAADAYFGD